MDIRSLGIRPVINCMGPVTILGGARMLDTCMAAMQSVAGTPVDIVELEHEVGRRLAALAGWPAACVTSGAAAAVELATAACVTGSDRGRIARLPSIEGTRRKVVVSRKQRNNFDHAVRNVGVTVVEYGWAHSYTEAWELEEVIDDATVAVVHFQAWESGANLTLSETASIAHRHGVAVVVDAAEALPPLTSLGPLRDEGADLVCVSGGKNLRGPQTSGLILGRLELIEACRANASPNPNTIGRPMKVGKEAMVGLLAACEAWKDVRLDGLLTGWRMTCFRLAEALSGLRGVTTSVEPGFRPGQPGYRLELRLDSDAAEDAASALAEKLAVGDPSIRVATVSTGLMIDPREVSMEDERLIAEGIRMAVGESD